MHFLTRMCGAIFILLAVITLIMGVIDTAPEAVAAQALHTGTETVLLVDDEDMILKVGSAMLRKLGYRVLTAEGGQKALEVLHNTRETIDLVILDLIMPGVNGMDICNRRSHPFFAGGIIW